MHGGWINNMIFSIIQKSQLEGAQRLDAEYYQPEYLDMEKKVKKFKNYLLKDLISSFTTGKNLKQINYSENLVKFIRTQNVRPILVSKNNLSSLSPLEKKFYKLSEGELLFVRVGEGVGNSSIITPEFSGSTLSDNVISVKVEKINPFYVSVYLNSKFGYLYWDRVSKGTARSLVSSENINSIRIPFISDKISIFCQKAVLDASNFYKNSEKIYQQAENLLLKELGFEDSDEQKENIFTVINLSEAKDACRLDAEYFNSDFNNLFSKIKKLSKPLGELADIKKGIEPGAEAYQEEGKQFIRVSSLSKFGVNETGQKCLSEELYQELKKDYQPEQGEILLTKDASPGVAYVLKENIEGIVSGGILRLKIKDKNISPEYLALCINSVVGQMQAERDAGGSVIKHWKPEQVKQTLIPILSKAIQEKISSLVKESFIARRKAKELLDEAKRKVEEMIEKGR